LSPLTELYNCLEMNFDKLFCHLSLNLNKQESQPRKPTINLLKSRLWVDAFVHLESKLNRASATFRSDKLRALRGVNNQPLKPKPNMPGAHLNAHTTAETPATNAEDDKGLSYEEMDQEPSGPGKRRVKRKITEAASKEFATTAGNVPATALNVAQMQTTLPPPA
jgi:hypothetical protein